MGAYAILRIHRPEPRTSRFQPRRRRSPGRGPSRRDAAPQRSSSRGPPPNCVRRVAQRYANGARALEAGAPRARAEKTGSPPDSRARIRPGKSPRTCLSRKPRSRTRGARPSTPRVLRDTRIPTYDRTENRGAPEPRRHLGLSSEQRHPQRTRRRRTETRPPRHPVRHSSEQHTSCVAIDSTNGVSPDSSEHQRSDPTLASRPSSRPPRLRSDRAPRLRRVHSIVRALQPHGHRTQSPRFGELTSRQECCCPEQLDFDGASRSTHHWGPPAFRSGSARHREGASSRRNHLSGQRFDRGGDQRAGAGLCGRGLRRPRSAASRTGPSR